MTSEERIEPSSNLTPDEQIEAANVETLRGAASV
jgi:hypothetical protein